MEYVKVLNLNNLIEACFNVYQEIGYQIGDRVRYYYEKQFLI